jgi:spore germination protein YaaH
MVAITDYSNGIFVIEDKVASFHEGFILHNGQLMFSLEVIRDTIDPNTFWDTNEQKVVLTTKDKTIRLKTDSLTAMVNLEPVNLTIPAEVIDERLYLPIEFLSEFFNIDVNWIPITNRVTIDFANTEGKIGKIIDENLRVGVKETPSIYSRNIEIISYNDSFIVFKEEYDYSWKKKNEGNLSDLKEWYKVRTATGRIGYIKKSLVETSHWSVIDNRAKERDVTPWRPDAGKVNLVWDHLTKSRRADLSEPAIKGLDIVSPTWFQLRDNQGNIDNIADINYVRWAHENGYKVWALFSNQFTPQLTSEFLRSTEARENAIRQLLILSELYNLDGINIDFENMYQQDRDMFSQFVRELTPILREQGLTISVDVTIKSSSPTWSLCYDRRALGEIVDYVAVMTYDEHWGASPVSGPVASFPWVERGIRGILEEVPPEKVLLGIPFYARVWEEKPGGSGIRVSSKAYGMSGISRIIRENNVDLKWDDRAGKYYGSYKQGNSTFRIWVEDEKSIELKLSLVEKYNLAGAASWRKGFEKPDIWEVLYRNLKEMYD